MFSQERKNILKALFDVQKEMYDEKIFFTKSADNPFFKSKYMPLPVLLQLAVPILHKHGLVLTQHSECPDGSGLIYVSTYISHVDSGEQASALFGAGAPDPQKAGAVITYGKRYGLEALLGVPTLDDDAESAMSRAKPAEPKKVKPKEKEGCITEKQQYELADLFQAKGIKGKAISDFLDKYIKGVRKLSDVKSHYYNAVKEAIAGKSKEAKKQDCGAELSETELPY
jgi:hypothetical protein